MVQDFAEIEEKKCQVIFIFQKCFEPIYKEGVSMKQGDNTMLSAKDLLIMSNLRRSARKNLTSISRETRIPVSTLFDKLKKFEKSVITKHTSLIDFNKLGYTTRANILLKVNRDDKDNLGRYLQMNEQVNSVFKITNGYDYFVEGIFKTIKDLEIFLDSIEGDYKISKKDVFYILDELKREEFLADPEMAKLITC